MAPLPAPRRYEFVLILGRTPFLATYITMLRQTSWNFVKLIFLFSALPLLRLFVAFSTSFTFIVVDPTQESVEFSSFWLTLPKVIVMATGEFEYSAEAEQFIAQVEAGTKHVTDNVFFF